MNPFKTAPMVSLVNLGLVLAALLYAALFLMTAGHPIIEAHSFRQTQTAISVYYMLNDGSFLNYMTPVTGTPWTIPFEAPVYHISVAIFSYVSPFSLDTNGRIVSALYWIGSLCLGYKILRYALPGKPLTASIFVLLALCSPLYIFWSRTFMIETTTLFYGLVFLYAVMRFTKDGQYCVLGIATLSGVLCILAKATTWPAFVIAGGIYFIAYNFNFLMNFRHSIITRPETLRFLTRGSLLLLAVLIALSAGLSWTHHSDAMKLQTHFGYELTAEALSTWNFGTSSDRFSGRFWNETVLGRALPEAIGQFWFIPFFVVGGLFLSKEEGVSFKKDITIIIASVLLFFIPMLIFTNLHMVHNYYQVGTSLFIIAAVAVIIGALLNSRRFNQILGLFALSIIIFGQVFIFATGYFPRMNAPELFAKTPQHQTALLAKEHVPEDTAILTTGLDWSSHLHYYAQRKGLALPLAWDVEKIRQMTEKPERVFGDLDVGGIVQCENIAEAKYNPKAATIIQKFIKNLLDNEEASWTTIVVNDCRLSYRTDL